MRLALTLAFAAAAAAFVPRTYTDLVRGVIRTDLGQPIELATIVVTYKRDTATVSTTIRTFGSGRYQTAIPNGPGIYTLRISSAGFADTTIQAHAIVNTLADSSRIVLANVQLRKR